MPRALSSSKNNSTANLGFEGKLWLAADKLRRHTDAAEYFQDQGKPLRRVSGFVLVHLPGNVRLRAKQPKQSTSTTRRLAGTTSQTGRST
ncbi:MAG: hypothetical protein M3R59_11425 [Verrucomicrobiota bacterium]|nr:hypothetical protein [Verrucomicrobiota bacterium]MDQ2918944.1 hypothetical protein [Verrucomicrobiota bacterium]